MSALRPEAGNVLHANLALAVTAHEAAASAANALSHAADVRGQCVAARGHLYDLKRRLYLDCAPVDRNGNGRARSLIASSLQFNAANGRRPH